MKKRFLSLGFMVTVCILLTVAASAAEIGVFVNDEPLKVPVAPYAESGTTMVPFRAIFEALGLEVNWNAAENSVTGKSADTDIRFVVGSNTATVNGSERVMALAPTAISGTTMVPVRFVAEAAGCVVNWDGDTQSVLIYRPGKNDLIRMWTNNLPANVNTLYATDGTGEYAGYRQLRGYPDESLFSIYFKGTSSSYSVTSRDNRALDLNEQITWTYNGKQYTNTRGDIYGFMGDTTLLSSRAGIDGGILSSDWFRSTFGTVYIDWIRKREFSQDAEQLTERFLEREEGIVRVDRFPPAVSEDRPPAGQIPAQEWLSTLDLQSEEISFSSHIERDEVSKNPVFVYWFCRYSPLDGTISANDMLYRVPDMTDEFYKSENQAEQIFSGIRFKIENSQIYFFASDLVNKGIL